MGFLIDELEIENKNIHRISPHGVCGFENMNLWKLLKFVNTFKLQIYKNFR